MVRRFCAGRASGLAFLAWPSGPGSARRADPACSGPSARPAAFARRRRSAKMTVPPGFSVEVVASEPDIVNPVAMTFDERGRVWITESLEYPRHSAGPGRDRVKVLEDTDGDGKADKFTVFADGLNIPSGIAVGTGASGSPTRPTSSSFRDTDGDGKADTPRGRRHRVRPVRHARAAQLADLGARRLSLRLERRLQPGQDRLSGQAVRVHLRHLPDRPEDPRLRGLLRGDEQPLGHRLGQGRLGLRQRLRDRPPLAPDRDRLLPPPGGALSAVHLEARIDRRPQAPEGRLLRNHLLRQRRLPREIPRTPVHGEHPREWHQRRPPRAQRLNLPRRRPSPTSSRPTTPGSCPSSRSRVPTAGSTSSTGTTATTATRTPTAIRTGSTASRGGSTGSATRTLRERPSSTSRRSRTNS